MSPACGRSWRGTRVLPESQTWPGSQTFVNIKTRCNLWWQKGREGAKELGGGGVELSDQVKQCLISGKEGEAKFDMNVDRDRHDHAILTLFLAPTGPLRKGDHPTVLPARRTGNGCVAPLPTGQP